jgi:hypothetical protein
MFAYTIRPAVQQTDHQALSILARELADEVQGSFSSRRLGSELVPSPFSGCYVFVAEADGNRRLATAKLAGLADVWVVFRRLDWCAPFQVFGEVVAGDRRGVDAGRGGASPVAVGVHLEHGTVVNEAIDGCDGDSRIREDTVPCAEGLISGDGEAAVLVASCDQLEEDAGLGLILMGVSDVVEDPEIEFVELDEGGFQGEVASGRLETLHEIRGARIEDTIPRLDEGVTDGGQQMRLATAGITDGHDVAAGLDPVTGSQRHDPGLGQGVDSREVDGGQGFACGKLRLQKMALNAPRITVAQFKLGQGSQEAGSQEAGSLPTFGIGTSGQFAPVPMEAGQAQCRQHGR